MSHIYKVGDKISTVIHGRRIKGEVTGVSARAIDTTIYKGHGRFTKRKGGYYVLEGKGTFSVYCGEFTLS